MNLYASPPPLASPTLAGLMSAADYSKLAAISGTNTGNVTLGTANGLSLIGQELSLAAAGVASAGAVTTGSQSFAGAKTFTGAVTVSGTLYAAGDAIADSVSVNRVTFPTGTNRAQLHGSNGSASTDIATILGTTLATASQHGSNRLFSVRSGIGGTELEKFAVQVGGSLTPIVTIAGRTDGGGSNNYHVNMTGGTAGWGGIHYNMGQGGLLVFGNYSMAAPGVESANRPLTFGQNSNAYDATALMKFTIQTATGVASTVPAFAFDVPTNMQSGQLALRMRNGTSQIFAIDRNGNAVMNTGTALYLGGAVSTGCYVYGQSTSQLEFGTLNATRATLTAASLTTASGTSITSGGNVSSSGSGSVNAGSAGFGVTASGFTHDITAGWAITDGASAEAVRVLSTTAFANAGASIMTWRNSNVFSATPVMKLLIDGTFEATTAGVGIILKSPDGTRYRLTVANGGTLSIAAA